MLDCNELSGAIMDAIEAAGLDEDGLGVTVRVMTEDGNVFEIGEVVSERGEVLLVVGERVL